MGLHSGEYVDPHVLDALVEVDLDADSVRPSRTDTLLQRCLAHPYMLQLRSRVRCAALTRRQLVGTMDAHCWSL
jgi:hypothetical protein